MHALGVLDTVRNCVMLQIVDGLGGKGEGRGISDMPTDDSKNSAYRPEPDRRCMLYFKWEICKARWHGTST